jgi:O-antigen/teichoic acid export membrane protein
MVTCPFISNAWKGKRTNRAMWQPGRLAGDTARMGLGLGLRALGQALIFIIFARTLGVEDYGAFTALIALACFVGCFAGFGGHVLIVRDVAREPSSFPQAWGATLALLGLSTPLLMLVYLVLAWTLPIPSVPYSAVVAVGLGELIFGTTANAASYAYRGFQRMGRAARLQSTPVFFRLVAAAGFLLWSTTQPSAEPTLVLWSYCYAGASLVAAMYALRLIQQDLGKPSMPARSLLQKWFFDGLPFSIWGVGESLYGDADKFMLARMDSLTHAGSYAAGYRFSGMAFLPLHALLNAAAPRLFHIGIRGLQGTRRAVLPLAPWTLGYALAVGSALFLGAPWMARLLGGDYSHTIVTTRWLAWLPLATTPRLLMQYALATSGRQGTAMVAVVLGGGLNILLNCYWIPVWGWQGAALATYAAEAGMAVTMLVLLLNIPANATERIQPTGADQCLP